MINIQKPPVDIVEDENFFLIAVDLPGVLPEDIEISGYEQGIEIKGIKRSFFRGKFILMERQTGIFKRRIDFKEFVNIEKAEAFIENGVLIIKVPKAKKEFYLKTSLKIIIRTPFRGSKK